eukprot:765435-Hanusia_phi.AAC.1
MKKYLRVAQTLMDKFPKDVGLRELVGEGIDAADADGRTSLHLCAFARGGEGTGRQCAAELVEAGASSARADLQGQMAMHAACEQGRGRLPSAAAGGEGRLRGGLQDDTGRVEPVRPSANRQERNCSPPLRGTSSLLPSLTPLPPEPRVEVPRCSQGSGAG